MGKLLVIHPHGKQLTLTYQTKEPPIELLQALVGGYVELFIITYEGERRHLYANEEGLGLNLPPNDWVTNHMHGSYCGEFVGTCVMDIPD